MSFETLKLSRKFLQLKYCEVVVEKNSYSMLFYLKLPISLLFLMVMLSVSLWKFRSWSPKDCVVFGFYFET